MTSFALPMIRVRKLGLKAKVLSLIPEFKPFLIAGALIAGFLMANMVTVHIWRIVTCNC